MCVRVVRVWRGRRERDSRDEREETGRGDADRKVTGALCLTERQDHRSQPRVNDLERVHDLRYCFFGVELHLEHIDATRN